jgi:YD repeat-containing protein
MFTVNDYDWTRPSQESLPGGTKRRYGYDPLIRVTNIVVHDPGENETLNYRYSYDKVNNITAKRTGRGDTTYDYDNLYRLTDAAHPDQPAEAFDYDPVGNRTSAADTAGPFSYNANNELEVYGDVTFRYDANGNTIEKSVGEVVTKFFYNLEDPLGEGGRWQRQCDRPLLL